MLLRLQKRVAHNSRGSGSRDSYHTTWLKIKCQLRRMEETRRTQCVCGRNLHEQFALQLEIQSKLRIYRFSYFLSIQMLNTAAFRWNPLELQGLEVVVHEELNEELRRSCCSTCARVHLFAVVEVVINPVPYVSLLRWGV